MVSETTWIAMGVAGTAVGGLVISLGGLSLVIGALERYFGKPGLTILKSVQKSNGFAVGMKWDAAKEPATIDSLTITLFNPYGDPTRATVKQKFAGQKSSFSIDLDMGPGLVKVLGGGNMDKAQIQILLGSSKDGIEFQFDFTGTQFRKLVSEANLTKDEYDKKAGLVDDGSAGPAYVVPTRSFIADTVPGKGDQLMIPTNPLFAATFAGGASDGGAAAGGGEAAAQENFSIKKVWIEPGCIVCNACEDIYPEVFDVQADTCLIKDNPPMDDGLRIQEAAEACPVEVIKYEPA